MGKRVSKVYTRTGDRGTTGLADGSRVPKHDARVETLGAVDETNSALGLVLAEDAVTADLRALLLGVQHDLFEIGAELSMPSYRHIGPADIAHLEAELDRINASLPALEEFVLPGGNRAAAASHLARTFCRRAERRAWALAEHEQISEDSLRYLNRLSDVLFVVARCLARLEGGAETLWQRERS